jgi:hypothetical protein
MTRGRESDRAYWLTANLAALASGLAAKVGHRPFPDETAQRTEITAWVTEFAAKIADGLEDRERLDWIQENKADAFTAWHDGEFQGWGIALPPGYEMVGDDSRDFRGAIDDARTARSARQDGAK